MLFRSTVVFISSLLICSGLAKLDLPEGSTCVTTNGVGKCVNIYMCESVLDDMRRNTMNNEICSFAGVVPIICCDACNTNQNITDAVEMTTGYLAWKTGNKAWDHCLDYAKHAAGRCRRTYSYGNEWLPKYNCTALMTEQQLTIGGRKAKRNEFPHMALLGYGEKLEDAQWQCGGSLISERFILTAAHCTYSSTLRTPVSFAALGILRRSDPAYMWQTYRVVSIFSHPEYALPVRYHDIALLKTDRQVVFSAAVFPACLFFNDSSEPVDVRNLKHFGTGWGALRRGGEQADNLQVVRVCEAVYRKKAGNFFFIEWTVTLTNPGVRVIEPPKASDMTHPLIEMSESSNSDNNRSYDCLICDKDGSSSQVQLGELLKIEVEVSSEEACREEYPTNRVLPRGVDNESQVCFGGLAVDTCEGDSGGPLQVDRGSTCMYEIVGVTSFGRACGTTGVGGIYTRVDAYLPWITNIVWP